MIIWFWIGFITFVLLLLALDLGVFHRKAHVVTVREALKWSAFWIALGLTFSVFIYFAYEHHWLGIGESYGKHVIDQTEVGENNPLGELDGSAAAVKYLTGYVIEKSLSVDNIFIIVMIFSSLAVPAMYQHRVLFWGILGALAMRGAMIALGATLISTFSWILYVFAGILIITAAKMLLTRESEPDPANSWFVRLARRIWPVTSGFHGEHFFVRAGSGASHEASTPTAVQERDEAVALYEKRSPGKLMVTPLFLALIVIEFTDLIFAVDSIPAIFAITTDPYLVFTSNVFAILGLRSLYFALAGVVRKFRYLKTALAVVLLVVGGKMLAHDWLKHVLGKYFNFYVLGAVLLILLAGVVASIIANRRGGGDAGDSHPDAGGTHQEGEERPALAARPSEPPTPVSHSSK